MAKGKSGGKRSATSTIAPASNTASSAPTPQITPTPVTPPTPAQVASGNVLPQGGIAFSQFESMTDDQKADVILKALGVSTPFFLDDSDLQKFAYFTGMSDKPQLVDENTLNSMSGQDLWRSVRSTYNKQTDMGYTSKDIYNQIATADYTMYSDSGGSVHGRAIYFDVSKGSYGSGKNYTVMHAKIAPTAKMTTESQLMKDYANESSRGTKLAKTLQLIHDSHSELSLYALAKGYDGYKSGNGYHMILNRRALVLSKQTF